jgi:hypothetical protein
LIAAIVALTCVTTAQAHELPESAAYGVAKRYVGSQESNKDARKRVLGCDRQSDHEVDCDVMISNIHDRSTARIFGAAYRQKCWTTVIVKYVSSTRRQIGQTNTGWNCESNHI